MRSDLQRSDDSTEMSQVVTLFHLFSAIFLSVSHLKCLWMSTAPGRPPKEEESAIFPIPIAVSPEAQAILERLDRSVRGAQESPEPAAKPPPDQVIRECEVMSPARRSAI